MALHVPDEIALRQLDIKLDLAGIAHVVIVEDDGSWQAIGIPPQERTGIRKVLSSLPLIK